MSGWCAMGTLPVASKHEPSYLQEGFISPEVYSPNQAFESRRACRFAWMKRRVLPVGEVSSSPMPSNPSTSTSEDELVLTWAHRQEDSRTACSRQAPLG